MYRRLTALALTAALLTGPALAAQTPQFMVPAKTYGDVHGFSEGYCVVENNLTPGHPFPDIRYGLLDWDGNEVIAPGKTKLDSFYAGMSAISVQSSDPDGSALWYVGFMDHSLQAVIPTTYDDYHSDYVQYYRFYDGMALVDVEAPYYQQLLDKTGAPIHTTRQGDSVFPSVNGIAFESPFGTEIYHHYNDPSTQNFYGIVGTYQDPATGEWKTPAERMLPGGHVTTNRYFIPRSDGTVSFFDLSDDPDYIYYGSPVSDGMTLVCDRAGKIGIARLDGAIVVPCQYDSLGLPSLNGILFGIRDGVPECFDLKGREYYTFLSKYHNVRNLTFDANNRYSTAPQCITLETRTPDDRQAWIYLDLEGNEVERHYVDSDKLLAQQWGLDDGWQIFDYVNDSKSGLIRIWKPSERLVSYLDLEGNVVFEPMEFHGSMGVDTRALNACVRPFYQGRAAFWRPDGKWVFLLHPDWVSQDAALSPCKVTVDGQSVDFNAYLMKNSNYFKLRDLAMALKGTPAEFSVEYEASSGVTYLKSASAYTPVGGELAAGDGVPLKWAMPTHAGLYFNGEDPDLLGFTIGQNNYYKLRDIAKLLNVNVTWDQATGTVAIDTGTAYQA